MRTQYVLACPPPTSLSVLRLEVGLVSETPACWRPGRRRRDRQDRLASKLLNEASLLITKYLFHFLRYFYFAHHRGPSRIFAITGGTRSYAAVEKACVALYQARSHFGDLSFALFVTP